MAEMISLKERLEDFIPSLENFCSKSPLQMNVSVVEETGDITLTSLYDVNFLYHFIYEPFLDKKSQIKKVKTDIEKQYPVVFDHKKLPLTKEEQEKLLSEGKDIRSILDIRKDVYLPRYKILRVHNKYNELDAFDFKTRKMVKFKMTIPLVNFLNKIFTISREELSEFFFQKTKFMYCIRN